jgi:hypothetical protein
MYLLSTPELEANLVSIALVSTAPDSELAIALHSYNSSPSPKLMRP